MIDSDKSGVVIPHEVEHFVKIKVDPKTGVLTMAQFMSGENMKPGMKKVRVFEMFCYRGGYEIREDDDEKGRGSTFWNISFFHLECILLSSPIDFSYPSSPIKFFKTL